MKEENGAETFLGIVTVLFLIGCIFCAIGTWFCGQTLDKDWVCTQFGPPKFSIWGGEKYQNCIQFTKDKKEK